LTSYNVYRKFSANNIN